MPVIKVKNMQGADVEELTLNDAVFGIEPNKPVMHEVVVNYLASLRRGTSCTKSRGEVRGGGRKPWRQKGTGRARAGTSRSPLWRGGAIIFGPKPRSYEYRVNKKKVSLAMRSALSDKVNEEALVVVDALSFDAPKTKEMIKVLAALGTDKKTLLVLPEVDEVVMKSARNIQGVTPVAVSELNTYEILNNNTLVLTKDALAKVEEVLA
ncbi:MAG: 50S ribosomal protein L4 [Peptococcaceae bacterium]|nr:50S ribosomal protein L4 [Peptococcaceae bacterium]